MLKFITLLHILPIKGDSNEHHNGLLREYYPKPNNFRKIPQRPISELVDSINARPRKKIQQRSAQLNFLNKDKVIINIAIDNREPII